MIGDFARAALLTIDMQRDFSEAGAVAEVAGTSGVIDHVDRLAGAFRRRDLPVLHAVRFYAHDGSNAEPFRRPWLEARGPVVAPDSPGAELAAGVAPAPAGKLRASALMDGEWQSLGPREWVFYKPRWSAFFRTELEARLRALDVEQLVVCGCNLPNCPRATLFDASERDFRAILVGDATSQATPARLDDLALIGVDVMTSDELLSRLAG